MCVHCARHRLKTRLICQSACIHCCSYLTLSRTCLADGPQQYAANGHYYQLVPTNLTYNAALEAASQAAYYQGLPGHLVTIADANEMTFIKTLVGSASVWIGAWDALTEGRYQFNAGPECGSNLTYFAWDVNQPDNLNNLEDCLEIWSPVNPQTWNDEQCSALRYYIVEYEQPAGTSKSFILSYHNAHSSDLLVVVVVGCRSNCFWMLLGVTGSISFPLFWSLSAVCLVLTSSSSSSLFRLCCIFSPSQRPWCAALATVTMSMCRLAL